MLCSCDEMRTFQLMYQTRFYSLSNLHKFGSSFSQSVELCILFYIYEDIYCSVMNWIHNSMFHNLFRSNTVKIIVLMSSSIIDIIYLCMFKIQ